MSQGIKGLGDAEIKAISQRVAARMITEYGEEGARFLYKSGSIGAAFARSVWIEICAELEKKS